MNLPLLVRFLLWPVSLLYGLITRLRAWLYRSGWFERKRLEGRVISVGNITVGGTGKTPMVLWLAEKFLADGKRVAILSRGYRGADGSSDEVELMKSRLHGRVSFGVGKNRFAAGQRLEAQQAIDIFILDDGFQHFQLARDLDILMLDGSRKLKDEWLLPTGVLREPILACRRADILVVTRKTGHPDFGTGGAHDSSTFYAQTRLLGFYRHDTDSNRRYVDELGPGPFFAFCGLGNPAAFFKDLSRWCVPIVGKSIFRDHHRYNAADLGALENAAKKAGATAFVTTEKDAQNLKSGPRSAFPIYVSVIDFVLTAESEFLAEVERKLRSVCGAVV
jgi:tetraacyldisaccharide 4'-kinase